MQLSIVSIIYALQSLDLFNVLLQRAIANPGMQLSVNNMFNFPVSNYNVNPTKESRQFNYQDEKRVDIYFILQPAWASPIWHGRLPPGSAPPYELG